MPPVAAKIVNFIEAPHVRLGLLAPLPARRMAPAGM
jgi:hypothetical protein